MHMFTRAFRCEVVLAIPGFDVCQGEGRQLTCRTSGKERRDAPNVDCAYCDGHQQSLPRMTVQIQTTVTRYNGKQFWFAVSMPAGTDGLIKNWNAIGFKMWFKNFFLVHRLEICKPRCFTWWLLLGGTHFALENRSGKLQYKNFAAGITAATGLRWRKTAICGSNTTWTRFLLSNDNVPFHVFICSLYIQCFLLCPKWAATRPTGSKSKSRSAAWWTWFWTSTPVNFDPTCYFIMFAQHHGAKLCESLHLWS